MRSVLRFLLGNLSGFTSAPFEQINPKTLGLTDLYMLHLLSEFVGTVIYCQERFILLIFSKISAYFILHYIFMPIFQALSAYQEMNFRKVTSLISSFINNSVSAFYFSIVKNR
jgi:isoleucyl-tRNA synthetase